MAIQTNDVPLIHASTITAPGGNAFAITPSDTARFNSWARGIYIGVAGNLTVVFQDNSTVTFNNVVAGSIIPVVCKGVMATNTTASNLVGLV